MNRRYGREYNTNEEYGSISQRERDDPRFGRPRWGDERNPNRGWADERNPSPGWAGERNPNPGWAGERNRGQGESRGPGNRNYDRPRQGYSGGQQGKGGQYGREYQGQRGAWEERGWGPGHNWNEQRSPSAWNEQRSASADDPRRWGSHSGYSGERYASGNWASQELAARSGGFFGKGPKGYTRSDERIREDVCDRLSDDDELDASEISVTVQGGEVTLEGSVPERRSKHRAEDLADSVSGVRDVHNHLRARKGLLQEVGDRLTGRDEAEQHGHSGSGTRSSPNENDTLGRMSSRTHS